MSLVASRLKLENSRGSDISPYFRLTQLLLTKSFIVHSSCLEQSLVSCWACCVLLSNWSLAPFPPFCITESHLAHFTQVSIYFVLLQPEDITHYSRTVEVGDASQIFHSLSPEASVHHKHVRYSYYNGSLNQDHLREPVKFRHTFVHVCKAFYPLFL